MPAKKTDTTVILIAYFSFIVLAMPGALLGIVWSPHMRASFSLGLDAVATLYITSSISYFMASFISGRLFSRFEIGLLLMGGCILNGLAAVGFALAPTWGIIVLLGFVSGFGAGLLDGGMNIYFAAHFDSRLMNWLHASFGIGATIAPVLISIVLANEGSWRLGYGLVAVLYAVVAGLFFISRTRWLPLNGLPEEATVASHVSVGATLRLPMVWAGIGIFALYTGLEASTGQWSKSIFFESRGIAETVASNWVALYWLSFTIGRISFGFIVRHIQTGRLLRLCMGGAIGSMLLFVWNPFLESGVLAVSLFGFMFSPIFALLITSTQERMGGQHAANAIGFQVAAATAGVGIWPGALGLIGVNFGLESITLALLLMAVGMTALHEVWRRLPTLPSSASHQS
jgi:fucose permease